MQKVSSPAESRRVSPRRAPSRRRRSGRDDLRRKYIEHGRHIEFQFLADRYRTSSTSASANAPSSGGTEAGRGGAELPADPQRSGRRWGGGREANADIGYVTAGTMSFLVDREGRFYALEVNTRIQWSTTVTEFISGFDIIRRCSSWRPASG
jgi:biotin carboxylase